MKKLFGTCIVALIMIMVYVPLSEAGSLTFYISDGNTTIPVTDGGPGDTNVAATGVINFSGYIGSWYVDIAAASNNSAPLEISGMVFSSNLTSPSTLQILAIQTELSEPATGFKITTGGITYGSVSVNMLYDGSIETSLGPYSPVAFGEASQVAVDTNGNPYSLGIEMRITAQGTQPNVTSFSGKIASVPEPSLVLLLGVGLFSLGFLKKWM